MQSNEEKYIYACVISSSADDWKYGETKSLVLTHIEGNNKTRVSVLGYKSDLVAYTNNFDAAAYLAPTAIGLVVSAVNGRCFYTNNQWPNSVLLKIKNARIRKNGYTGGYTTQY